jgi:hypothetical protein
MLTEARHGGEVQGGKKCGIVKGMGTGQGEGERHCGKGQGKGQETKAKGKGIWHRGKWEDKK